HLHLLLPLFLLPSPPPPTPTVFPYTTLFRSLRASRAPHGCGRAARAPRRPHAARCARSAAAHATPRRGVGRAPRTGRGARPTPRDRKSTRLNSSHLGISYAVFCLKKKKKIEK